MACSSGVVTDDSTASADAPVYTDETVTVGGATLGNCAIGNVGIATRPISKITSEATDAKIGRFKKKSITLFWTQPIARWFPQPYGRRRLLPESVRALRAPPAGHRR